MKLLICWLLLFDSATALVQLTIAKKPAQLKYARVEAKLHGEFLIRDWQLIFHNEGRWVAEGDLRCSLEEDEEVISFAMDVNGHRRDAVVVPTKRARYAYETIVARGVDPGLLEVNEEASEFRTRVFPIPAKGDKTVWIRTVRFVEEEKVNVWPTGLDQANRWDLVIETKGGKAGEFKALQSGTGQNYPQALLSWKPDAGVVYRGEHGDVHLANGDRVKPKAQMIEIWLDGTTKPTAKALDALKELLAQFGDAGARLRVFREELGEVRDFVIHGGIAELLIEAIEKEERWGLARPSRLPWKSIETDALVLITDGEYVFGKAEFEGLACPLHVVDSGPGKSSWLRGRALASGGGWHGAHGLDPWMGVSAEGAKVIGEIGGQICVLKKTDGGLESPVGDWLGARLARDEMKARGEDQSVIDAFNLKHGVMDGNSSLIVLETVNQYLEFGIVPPESDETLYASWEKKRQPATVSRRGHLERLETAWNRRCDRLSKPLLPLGERLMKQAQESSRRLSELPELDGEIVQELVIPLQSKLATISSLADNGIEPVEIEKLKTLVNEAQELKRKVREVAPEVYVTVGGQVRRPGRLVLKLGVTLSEAIEAAGGETPFGAMNRVKLYRRGKVYQYNMKDPSSRSIRLYSRDVVEVPQVNLLGNGGSGPAGTAPFSPKGDGKIVFERGESHPVQYYLVDLKKGLEQEESWFARYKVFREVCGWRADFYLNVSEFLRSRGEDQKAIRVIADLAELMPENPEILRRAGMAYRRVGRSKLSRDIFRRVLALKPHSGVACADFARSEEILGNGESALRWYWRAIQVEDSRYTKGRALVYLEEMNALIVREGLDGEKFGIDPGLIRHIPVEFRVVLRWDADQSNFDLWVRKPVGWVTWEGAAADAGDVEWWSGNLSQGYGPESWSSRSLLPGAYEIGARFYGDWNSEGKSTATAEVEVIRNFGQKNETRETYTLRVEEKTNPLIVRAKYYPKGWE